MSIEKQPFPVEEVRAEYWEVASDLFANLESKYVEALVEEELHPDLVYITTGTEVVPFPKPHEQPTVSFYLVSDYERHTINEGEVLEVRLPVDAVGDKSSALLWFEEPSDSEEGQQDSRQTWAIIRHVLPKKGRTYFITRKDAVPYKPVTRLGYVSSRRSRTFTEAVRDKAAAYKVISVKPRL
jgi:hypothetical protein